mgnify:CR=1 FL=1
MFFQSNGPGACPVCIVACKSTVVSRLQVLYHKNIPDINRHLQERAHRQVHLVRPQHGQAVAPGRHAADVAAFLRVVAETPELDRRAGDRLPVLRIDDPDLRSVSGALDHDGEVGDEDQRARTLSAAGRFEQVIVLTHVPPFPETAWHEGRHSEPDWQPGFTCRAMGEELLAAAAQNPDTMFTVLCGHTHGEGEVAVLPNLTVLTGGAEYRQPEVQRVFDLRARSQTD